MSGVEVPGPDGMQSSRYLVACFRAKCCKLLLGAQCDRHTHYHLLYSFALDKLTTNCSVRLSNSPFKKLTLPRYKFFFREVKCGVITSYFCA